MPKLLQINVVSNVLSTGKIAEDIAKVAMKEGWECYIAYGREAKPGVNIEIRIGSMLDVYAHYVGHRLFDKEGWGSVSATRELVCKIREIKPDIVQLHNIHDHYLNYPILFECLAEIDVPVVWVQHDCWAFTGGCMYFDQINCEEWKKSCNDCSMKRAIFTNRSSQHFQIKRKLLKQIKSLTFVPVSKWMGDLIKSSVQGERDIKVIHNGVDLKKFKIVKEKEHFGTKFRILGIASVWGKRKGLDDFIKLRQLLPNTYEITLVGLSEKQISSLPSGVNGITRTTNVQELVHLYNSSDVFVNPTYSDNFPTVNIEALACGTPVITYETGGSPEAVDEKTGIVIPQGDINALASAIRHLKESPLSSSDCRKRAENLFDKDKCFAQYISLYNDLLSK